MATTIPARRAWRTVTLATAALCGAAPALAASCEDLTATTLPYATVTVAALVTGGTFTPPTGAAQMDLPDFCRVALTLAPTADSTSALRSGCR